MSEHEAPQEPTVEETEVDETQSPPNPPTEVRPPNFVPPDPPSDVPVVAPGYVPPEVEPTVDPLDEPMRDKDDLE